MSPALFQFEVGGQTAERLMVLGLRHRADVFFPKDGEPLDGDAPFVHAPLADGSTLPFRKRTGGVPDEEPAFSLERVQRTTSRFKAARSKRTLVVIRRRASPLLR
jgi:hypothetical protein